MKKTSAQKVWELLKNEGPLTANQIAKRVKGMNTTQASTATSNLFARDLIEKRKDVQTRRMMYWLVKEHPALYPSTHSTHYIRAADAKYLAPKEDPVDPLLAALWREHPHIMRHYEAQGLRVERVA